MAQPSSQQQIPPRTFSPLSAPGHSPQDGTFLPASKRQRLSPNEASPYQSPNMANISLPNQVYSRSPYPNSMTNGQNYGTTFNTMNPVSPRTTQSPAPASQQSPMNSSSGAMGPPSKPQVEKPMDLNQLQDVLQGSGIDIAQEDAALINSFRQQEDTAGGGTSSGTSYQPSNQPNLYALNVPGGKDSFYGAGSFNQPAVPLRDPDEERAEIEKKAKRVLAEQKQYHLNAPFLNVGWVKKRLTDMANTTKVKSTTSGVLMPGPNAQPVSMWVHGQDGHEKLVKLRGEELLYSDSPLTEILTLISLATQERMRVIIEDAAVVAKSRKTKSLGIVPAEMIELANKSEAKEVEAALPTSTERVVTPRSQGLKRSYATMNGPPTPVSNESQSTVRTLTYPNLQAEALHKQMNEARLVEQERSRKRRRREEAKSKDSSRPGSTVPDLIVPNPNSSIGERAPDVETLKGGKKLTKRAAAAQATEAQQHAATNQALAGALGSIGFGGRKSGPSWLLGGSKTPKSGPALARTMAGMSSSNAMTIAKEETSNLPEARSFGVFREDHEGGRGIQLRDVLSVLESDGKDKKILSRAYAKLSPHLGLRRAT